MIKFIKITNLNDEKIILSSDFIRLVKVIDGVTNIDFDEEMIQVKETIDEIFNMLEMPPRPPHHEKPCPHEEMALNEKPHNLEVPVQDELETLQQEKLETPQQEEQKVEEETPKEESTKETPKEKEESVNEEIFPSNNAFTEILKSEDKSEEKKEEPDPNNPYHKYSK